MSDAEKRSEMTTEITLDSQHLRLLHIIYKRPEGIKARDLVAELIAHGWCDKDTTPADLGLHPDDVLSPPRLPANEP